MKQNQEQEQQQTAQPKQTEAQEQPKEIDPYLMVKDRGEMVLVVHVPYLLDYLAQMMKLEPSSFLDKSNPDWFKDNFIAGMDALANELIEKLEGSTQPKVSEK